MVKVRTRGKHIVLGIIIRLAAVFTMLLAGLSFFSGSIIGATPAPLQLLELSPATLLARGMSF